MAESIIFVIIVILIAYVFDFINGFHDAANSIATIVTTEVLTPRQAVIWAAFFNLIAFFCFNLMVAKTIGNGLIDMSIIDTKLIFASLIGATLWNLLTWYYGIPSSSSHALIGGLAGAALAKGGIDSLEAEGFIKVAIGIVLSPLLGLFISFTITYIVKIFISNKNEHKFKSTFKAFQLASSALLSLTHGGNDAQKTMGIIALVLFSSGQLQGDFFVPFWVVISCQAVISLGTLAGGWRIVKTMGTKITKINPLNGCTAESSAAAIIFAATEFGVPVSTTQMVTGAIAGTGLTKGRKGAQWSILRVMIMSWIITIPASGLVAAILIKIMSYV